MYLRQSVLATNRPRRSDSIEISETCEATKVFSDTSTIIPFMFTAIPARLRFAIDRYSQNRHKSLLYWVLRWRKRITTNILAPLCALGLLAIYLKKHSYHLSYNLSSQRHYALGCPLFTNLVVLKNNMWFKS